MRFLILCMSFLITGTIFGYEFNMQFTKISANEVNFTTVYTGASAVIRLPRTGRIISFPEQASARAANGTIRVGTEGDGVEDYVVRFTYSVVLPNQGGYGSISKNWYPTISQDEVVEYKVTELTPTKGMFVYPYTSYNSNEFTFMSTQKDVRLATISNEVSQDTDSTPTIDIFSARGISASPSEIRAIQQYMSDNLGNKNIEHIAVINSSLAQDNSFIEGNTLYLNIAGVGNIDQIKTATAIAWRGATDTSLISPRLFTMFQDAVFRLSPLTIAQSSQSTDSNTQATPEATPEATTTPAPASTQDLGAIVLVPPVTYYEDLFNQGFESNTIQNVDAEGIINNYALLHMAQYNIDSESLVTGIRQFFSSLGTSASTEVQQAVATEVTTDATTDTNAVVAAVTTNTNTNTTSKEDIDKINWATITQNKLQEPLFSLYTKEVLKEKGLVPKIIAKGKVVTRNSYNIPNFQITGVDGSTIPVEWNNFRSVSINLSEGEYELDSDRVVPQQSFMESFYSFDTNTMQLRRRILAMADRRTAPGEINLRQHLQMNQFTAGEGNGFNVPAGDTVYVVISHILSNTTGALKAGIKENFFSMNADGEITHLATRLRI